MQPTPPHHLPPPEPKPDRIVQLDALRGVAAIWVMLYHYTIQFSGDYGHGPGVWRVPYGQRAVELFFMISGFVIPLTLGRTKRAMDFVVSRFSRLYPAFWTCLAITTVATIVFRLPHASISVADVLRNATMMPSLLFHKAYVDPSYWTLEVELLFYVIAFLAWRAGGMRGVSVCIAGLTALSMVEGILLRAVGVGFGGLIEALLLLYFIPQFACGYATFLLRQRGWNAYSVGLIALSVVTVGVRNGPGWQDTLAYPLFTLALLGGLGLAAFGKFPGLSTRPLLWVGMISYPLYLLHQNIGYLVILAGYRQGLWPNVNVVLAIIVSTLLATTVSLAVERPAMRGIRGWYRQHFGKPAA